MRAHITQVLWSHGRCTSQILKIWRPDLEERQHERNRAVLLTHQLKLSARPELMLRRPIFAVLVLARIIRRRAPRELGRVQVKLKPARAMAVVHLAARLTAHMQRAALAAATRLDLRRRLQAVVRAAVLRGWAPGERAAVRVVTAGAVGRRGGRANERVLEHLDGDALRGAVEAGGVWRAGVCSG